MLIVDSEMGYSVIVKKPGRWPIRFHGILLPAVVLVMVLGGAPAWASCAESPDLETRFAEAGVVFIGVVVELSNHDRNAVMEVEQVWKGPELPETVTVEGGPEDPKVFSSVDRTFQRGTYVVFPVNSEPPFRDNACTLTRRTSSALDVINPYATEPPEDPNEPAPVTTAIAGAGGETLVATTDALDEATAEPEEREEASVVPWAIAAGVTLALVVAGYVMVQRRSS